MASTESRPAVQQGAEPPPRQAGASRWGAIRDWWWFGASRGSAGLLPWPPGQFENLRPVRWFVLSAGAILLLVGLAKIASSFGTSGIQSVADPIFGLPFRVLMRSAGTFELAVSLLCLFGSNKGSGLVLAIFVGLNLLAYRTGVWLMDWHRPCSCLGGLTDLLRLSPRTSDTIAKFVLAYLLIGGLGALAWTRRAAESASSVDDEESPRAPSEGSGAQDRKGRQSRLEPKSYRNVSN
jgi:hypothetical protein